MSAPVVAENATTPNSPEFPDSSTCKQVALTIEELEALPDDTILRASGRFSRITTWGSPIDTRIQATGHFTDCTIRPVPLDWTNGQRVFEVLAMGASRSDQFMVTVPELIDSGRVLS